MERRSQGSIVGEDTPTDAFLGPPNAPQSPKFEESNIMQDDGGTRNIMINNTSEESIVR